MLNITTKNYEQTAKFFLPLSNVRISLFNLVFRFSNPTEKKIPENKKPHM